MGALTFEEIAERSLTCDRDCNVFEGSRKVGTLPEGSYVYRRLHRASPVQGEDGVLVVQNHLVYVVSFERREYEVRMKRPDFVKCSNCGKYAAPSDKRWDMLCCSGCGSNNIDYYN